MNAFILSVCIFALYFVLVISHGFALGSLAFILVIAICLVLLYVKSRSGGSSSEGGNL